MAAACAGINCPMLTSVPNGFVYGFQAMASPCEIRVETDDADLADKLGRLGEAEARRIEEKYSRYRPESPLSKINAASGRPVEVDSETADLLDYAAQCHALSEGLFDVTSGVLRRVWKFDGSDRVPTQAEIDTVLPLVGWEKVVWRRPWLTLASQMEIDLGGLGKEYAVDSTLMRLIAVTDAPVLVNFGGDLRVSGPRLRGGRWPVVIESVDRAGVSEALLEITSGALTTSGDARRFLLKDGVRFSHILDPRSGRPVEDPPRSVTVAAATCMEAGLLSTLAMLQGRGAEAFLEGEGIQAWWIR
jgi:thiamine biosynthesis lipoprotein